MTLLVLLNACSEPISIDGISSYDLSRSSSSEEGDWWNDILDSSDDSSAEENSSSIPLSSSDYSSSESSNNSNNESSNLSSAGIESSSSSVPESSSVEPTDAEKRAVLNEEIDYIFDDIGDVKTYEIVIDPAALARMDAAPKAEQYEWADFKFEGETIERVQVRYKGSYGAWVNCTEGDVGSSVGKKTCIKLSTKIKFNTDDDPERKFFGLKKLNFYHMHFYDNQMKDRLSYWMHRAMGQPAPRVVHVKLKINGTLIGLYSLIEQIDGRFTRAHWDDGEGNIYKEHIPVKNGDLSTDNKLFEKLETNEDENPTYDTWQGFEQELLDANGTESIKSVIRKYWDIENLVSVILTSNAMDHWDSPFTRDDGHNSYWYSDTTTEKLYPIPWDMDNASYV
ncbi:MAG: CotH kinase family protein, partial [Reichenbachiella sp.]